MCGYAKAKIKDKEVNLDLGYGGGLFCIADDFCYSDKDDQKDREQMTRLLCKYKKIEIVSMLLDLVDNAEEG